MRRQMVCSNQSCALLFFCKLQAHQKLHVFLKGEKTFVVIRVRNTLHVLISEAVDLFVGKSKRTQIEPADREDFILFTPIKCVRWFSPSVGMSTLQQCQRAKANKHRYSTALVVRLCRLLAKAVRL